jgi:hypothetical protein
MPASDKIRNNLRVESKRLSTGINKDESGEAKLINTLQFKKSIKKEFVGKISEQKGHKQDGAHALDDEI